MRHIREYFKIIYEVYKASVRSPVGNSPAATSLDSPGSPFPQIGNSIDWGYLLGEPFTEEPCGPVM